MELHEMNYNHETQVECSARSPKVHASQYYEVPSNGLNSFTQV